MAGGKDTKKGTSPGPKDSVGGHASESDEYDSDAEALDQLRQLEEKEKAALLEKDKLLAELQERKKAKELAKKRAETGALAGSSGGTGARNHSQDAKKESLAVCIFTFQAEAHVSAPNTFVMPMRMTPQHNGIKDLLNAEAKDMPVKVVFCEKDKVYKMYDVKDQK